MVEYLLQMRVDHVEYKWGLASAYDEALQAAHEHDVAQLSTALAAAHKALGCASERWEGEGWCGSTR